jgi:hypothetical protein
LKNLHFLRVGKRDNRQTTIKERKVKEYPIKGHAMTTTMMMKRNKASEKVEQKEIK